MTRIPTSLQQQARQYATEKHSRQTYDGQPYTVHLRAVEKVLSDFGYISSEWVAAAWLHDVFEGTDANLEELKTMCPSITPWVIGGIKILTTGGGGRLEKYHVIAKDQDACSAILQMADRIANIEHRFRDKSGAIKIYLKEREEFAKCLYPIGTVRHGETA